MIFVLNFEFLFIFAPNMLQIPKFIQKTLSVRISLMVVFAMAILLIASMVIMLHYSRKAMKEEAVQNALQTLDGTIHQVDNILLSVEQTTGNMIWGLMTNLDNPEAMFTFSRKVIETNPYVAGCAIAYKEDYLPGKKLFMAYVHRGDSASKVYGSSKIVVDSTFGSRPYTEQVWYTEPMKGKMGWINPLLGMDSEEAPIVTFALPLYGKDRKPAAVIGVDISLSLLSDIVLAAKPSANSYCTLLDRDGTFIVHPDDNKLNQQTAVSLSDQSMKEAAKAMMSGQTGYKPFRLNNTDYYIFYKPFKRTAVPGRAATDIGWSTGIIYPENDIFGNYNSLSYYVLVITVVGLLLLFFLCRFIIHRQLKPLLMLSDKAQLIAEGKYDEPIPDSRQKDEIGRLQANFKQMQQSLSSHIKELEELKETLQIHGEELREALIQEQKADRMKTSFLHNMTNQMIIPSETILKDVEKLCDANREITVKEVNQLVDEIQEKGNFIADLLNNLLRLSDEEVRKEVKDA